MTTDAPKSHPFQDDLVLEMPAVAKEQTILNHLLANWLVQGHGPAPYAESHFDFHFLRGTIAEVDDIVCRADMRMPTADKLPAGYGTPEVCVDAMGYHSWPKADVAGDTFTGSLIMGYWKGNVIFLEPMIPVSTFTKKATFEIPSSKPASAGGKTTLYPTRMVASWDAKTSRPRSTCSSSTRSRRSTDRRGPLAARSLALRDLADARVARVHQRAGAQHLVLEVGAVGREALPAGHALCGEDADRAQARQLAAQARVVLA